MSTIALVLSLIFSSLTANSETAAAQTTNIECPAGQNNCDFILTEEVNH